MSIDVLAKAVNLLIFIDRLSSFNTWDRNKYCTYSNIRFSIIMIFHSLHVEHCHFQFPFLSSRWVYSLLFLIKVISTRCAWDDEKEEKKHTHTRSIEKTMKLKIHFLSKWFIIIFIRWLSFPRMQVDWHFSKTEYTLSHFSPSLSLFLSFIVHIHLFFSSSSMMVIIIIIIIRGEKKRINRFHTSEVFWQVDK